MKLLNSRHARFGALISRVAPRIAKDIATNRGVLLGTWLQKACLDGQVALHVQRQDGHGLTEMHKSKWKGARGIEFHSRNANSRLGYFRDHHANKVLPEVRRVLDDPDLGVNRIIDIGCGDGKILHHIMGHFDDVAEGIGIDLSTYAIAAAKRDYEADERLAFVAGNALETLDICLRPGTLVMTNGGVLEYSDREQVQKLLARVARARPAAIFLAEPLADTYDLDRDTGSVIFSREVTFCHNYPLLMREAGFEETFRSIFTVGSARWLLIGGRVV